MKKLLAKLGLIALIVPYMLSGLYALAYPAQTKIVATGSTKNVNVSRSLAFDGTGDYVATTPLGDHSFGTSNWSVDFWLKTATTSRGIIFTSRIDNANQVALRVNDTVGSGILEAAEYNGSTYTAAIKTVTGAIKLGVWTHVTYAVSGTTGVLYVNGAISPGGSGNAGGALGANNSATIGARNDRTFGFFLGSMDNIRVYNKTLTEEESKKLDRGIIIKDSLVREYTFDSLSSTIAYDTSSNGNHGTITGAVPDTNVPSNASPSEPLVKTMVSGVSRSARFDGVTSRITASRLSSLSGSYSVNIWVKPTEFTTNGAFISHRGNNAGDFTFRFSDTSGNFQFLRWTGSTNQFIRRTASSPLSLNAWSMMTAVWDGSTMTLYKNGLSIGYSETASTASLSDSPLYIGRDDSAYFKGLEDQARIYSRALSASEVASLYANRNIPQDDLVEEWDMNENDGNIFHGKKGNDGTGTNVTRSYDVPN